MENITEILDSFYCPITQEIMTDPVICPEGYSFEKKAILTWLSQKQISPITRSPLGAIGLRPNRALKESIDKIRHLIDKSKLKKATPLAIKCSEEMINILKKSLNDINLTMNYNHGLLNVKVNVPNSSTRAPSNVVLVIDVSASMGSEATLKNENGHDESHGFSLLDIVKQAAHTVRVCLKDCDTLSIVSYSSNAKVIIPPTPMDNTGQLLCKAAIDQLMPDSRTNIWDGILKALDLCRENNTPEKHNKILLLTDGQPNVIPPRGHVGMIKSYRETHGELPASIDTFGFGYSLDSIDLNNIANACMGNYGFIPDSTMVGDMFSNCLANLLSVASPYSNVLIELPNDINFTSNPVIGNHTYEIASWGISVDTGALYYGQEKCFTFRIDPIKDTNLIPQIQATIRYNHFNESKQVTYNCQLQTEEEILPNLIQQYRLLFVENVTEAWNLMRRGEEDIARTLIHSFLDNISKSKVANHPFIKDLITDLNDQVSIAFSKSAYFTKWGQHYIPSLVRAHQQQVCNNFKDPGVQHYGTELFNTIRDQADEKYNALPAPKPTANISYNTYRGGSSNITRSVAPATMVSYNTRGGSCFHGDCIVKMYDGTVKLVKDIRQGDKILTSDSSKNYQDTIQCVLKTSILTGTTQLVTLSNGWTGTPWHPIKHNGTWIFPCKLSNPYEANCNAVYSFVLNNRSSIYINNIESISLAHGINNNSVTSHDYFGTNKVINNLNKHIGWSMGYIEITDICIMRDPNTGLVNEIIPLHELESSYN